MSTTRDALAELVALRDMNDAMHATDSPEEHERLYKAGVNRSAAAWAAARAALAQSDAQPIGYLCRHKESVRQALQYEPNEDTGYLWQYTHGTKGMLDFEGMDHLEVQRVYSAASPQEAPSEPTGGLTKP